MCKFMKDICKTERSFFWRCKLSVVALKHFNCCYFKNSHKYLVNIFHDNMEQFTGMRVLSLFFFKIICLDKIVSSATYCLCNTDVIPEPWIFPFTQNGYTVFLERQLFAQDKLKIEKYRGSFFRKLNILKNECSYCSYYIAVLEGEQNSDLFIYTEEFHALPNIFISEHLSLATSSFSNALECTHSFLQGWQISPPFNR